MQVAGAAEALCVSMRSEDFEVEDFAAAEGSDAAGAADDDGDAGDGDAAPSSAAGDDDDDEERDRREFGIYQCLPADDGEPDWASGEAATVEEYMRRVRAEARALPAVVAAAAGVGVAAAAGAAGAAGKAPCSPEQPRAPARRDGGDDQGCAPELRPSPAWAAGFLRGFAALRLALQAEVDRPGDGPPPSALMPELAALRGLDQVAVQRRLVDAVARVCAWPAGGGDGGGGAEEEGPAAGEPLDDAAAARLYALAARLEKPARPEAAAAFAALLRRCGAAAAAGAGGHDPALPRLAVLAAVAGGCFGQDAELARVWEVAEAEVEAEAEAAALGTL